MGKGEWGGMGGIAAREGAGLQKGNREGRFGVGERRRTESGEV